MSGKAVTAAVYLTVILSIFFLLPPLLPVHKRCKFPSLWLLLLAPTHLFCPLSFSFLLSFTAREVKPQPHEAVSICSNPCFKCLPHHLLLSHHLMLFICQFICPQVLSPAALRVPISRHCFISPQGFNTLFSSSLQHLSFGILIKLPDRIIHAHTVPLTCSSLQLVVTTAEKPCVHFGCSEDYTQIP